MKKESMVEQLKSHIVNVTFTKANGDERVMKCSLQTDVLPPHENKTSTRKPNLDVIPGWDLESEGWRSFRVDSVTSFVVQL